jgi:hypothetical protein
MKTIEITVSSEGKTTVQTKGFSGPSCREASRFLEQAIGSRVSEQTTAEFHQQESTRQSQQQQYRQAYRLQQTRRSCPGCGDDGSTYY